MPQNLKKRAEELERRIKERAEVVKKVLREYRETVRASGNATKRVQTRARESIDKKRLDVERANAEYIQLQKELARLRSQMQAGK